MTSEAAIWWKHVVVYQIYPRGFQDASGDGVTGHSSCPLSTRGNLDGPLSAPSCQRRSTYL